MGKGKGKKLKMNVNMTALVCSALGCIFVLMSIFIPNWLSNPSGLNYYPYPRVWGLWYVTGRLSMTMFQAWENQCKIAATYMLDAPCITPLCKWYEGKCAAYRMQAIVSNTTGIALSLLIPAVIIANLWSLRVRASARKWTTIISFAVFVLPFAILALYFGIMGASFDIINSNGYYPVPQPSVGIFFLGIGVFFFFFAFVAHAIRGRKMQKEEEFEEDTFWDVAQMRQQYGI